MASEVPNVKIVYGADAANAPTPANTNQIMIEAEITLKISVPPQMAEIVERIFIGETEYVRVGKIAPESGTQPEIDRKAAAADIKKHRIGDTLSVDMSEYIKGTTSFCRNCLKEFTYIRKTNTRNFCDDCRAGTSKPVPVRSSQVTTGNKKTGTCKKCDQQFSYIGRTGARKYCDDHQPAASKSYVPKPSKSKPAFGAKGASTGIDQKAAAALNKHHLGASLQVKDGD